MAHEKCRSTEARNNSSVYECGSNLFRYVRQHLAATMQTGSVLSKLLLLFIAALAQAQDLFEGDELLASTEPEVVSKRNTTIFTGVGVTLGAVIVLAVGAICCRRRSSVSYSQVA